MSAYVGVLVLDLFGDYTCLLVIVSLEFGRFLRVDFCDGFI